MARLPVVYYEVTTHTPSLLDVHTTHYTAARHVRSSVRPQIITQLRAHYRVQVSLRQLHWLSCPGSCVWRRGAPPADRAREGQCALWALTAVPASRNLWPGGCWRLLCMLGVYSKQNLYT